MVNQWISRDEKQSMALKSDKSKDRRGENDVSETDKIEVLEVVNITIVGAPARFAFSIGV